MSLLAYANAIRNIARALNWGGGVEKRISQNRKLLKLLQQEAPDLVGKHPEVVGWLQANDKFLTELESTMALEEGLLRSVTAGIGARLEAPHRHQVHQPERRPS